MKAILGRCFALLTLALICSAYGRADGGADFKIRCASCHGSKGTGDSKMGQSLHVRDLSSAEVQKQSDAELASIIGKGRGVMPAYSSRLSKEQIADIVKYIRTLKK